MPLAYNFIKREYALRTGSSIGTGQATLEASYTGSWATSLDGSEIPISAIKTQILNIERELAHIIGSDAQHPYRSMLYGRSVGLANLANTPTLDNAGAEFIGVFDAVTDSSDFTPLTVQPTQTISDELDPFFDDTDLYNYDIRGNKIRHTRTLVYMEGCVWDYTIRAAAYDADGNSPLPQMLANTWIAGCMAMSGQIGWEGSASTISMYENLYQQGIQILKMRGDGMVNLPLASQNVVAG